MIHIMYELRLGQMIIPINQACHHLLVHGQHHAGVYGRGSSWLRHARIYSTGWYQDPILTVIKQLMILEHYKTISGHDGNILVA